MNVRRSTGASRARHRGNFDSTLGNPLAPATGDQMTLRRRHLLTRAAAPLLAPTGVWPQAPRRRLVGVLTQAADFERFDEWRAFAGEMARLGHVAGRSVEYVHRSVGTDAEPELSKRMAQRAAELARMNVDVIYLAEGDPALRAVRQAVRTIPIVVDRFFLDPVELGYVASFSRPGGNVTGNAVLGLELEAKAIELLAQTLGAVGVLGVLESSFQRTFVNYARVMTAREAVARRLGVRLALRTADNFEQLAPMLAQMRRDGVRAVKFDDPEYFADRRAAVAAAFMAERMPAVSIEPAYARAGLLMSFGWDVEDIARRSALYVDRILRGASPRELPVEQVSKFKVAVNVRTARAIGVVVAPSLLARADEVIE